MLRCRVFLRQGILRKRRLPVRTFPARVPPTSKNGFAVSVQYWDRRWREYERRSQRSRSIYRRRRIFLEPKGHIVPAGSAARLRLAEAAAADPYQWRLSE